MGNLDDKPRANPSTTASASPNLTPGTQPTLSPAACCGTNKILTPKLEYEGESSLSAQAAFANRFLRDAVVNKPSVDITGEIASVLDSLSRTLGNKTNQQDVDYLYPNARTLEPGQTIRNLPMPPVESAFVCLRMAQEHPRVKFFWNHEANSVSRFTEFFLKVYSPGDASYADLITVNAGLYWLFSECKNVAPDPVTKAHYREQATVCRDNLETVLSNLPFHLPSNLDTTSSMFMAAVYCIELCKPSAAWNFITTASHMSQTLGMHNVVAMAHDAPEVKALKIRLFWLIYIHEKALSLRLGRSSTIRDGDVTVSPPVTDWRAEIAVFAQLGQWIELARLQGMVYDQIYSPAALIQPQAIRIARARRLASELEAHTARRHSDLEAHSSKISVDNRQYVEALRQALGVDLVDVFDHTNSVNHLSLFCLIYRAIPPDPSEGTIFSKECIESARQALEEHRRCMEVLIKVEEEFLESYINWALLQSPFVPFTVLFCHVVETGNQADLDRLGSLVEILQPVSADSFSTGVKKELRLFKVLYDVACSYMKLRTEAGNRPAGASGANPWGPGGNSLLSQLSVQQPELIPTPDSACQRGISSQTPFTGLDSAGMSSGAAFGESGSVAGWLSGVSFPMSGDLAMEVDQQGAELGNWLYMNNQMMRALEDSYF
ncbi:fungal specific transcription factor [Colletotrichum sojae]|uniref:Fungal specific transcription factor n=1 Tax=Colletotrichum sojae TaxID=2175907 RepID=A0A8H6MSQ2_9PEZI|nr:fungal specific transcription factor [Colletotrichum sojae]